MSNESTSNASSSPQEQEWVTVRAYREFMHFYFKVLDNVHTNCSQKFFACESIVFLFTLAVACPIIFVINPRFPCSIAVLASAAAFSAVVLIGFYTYFIMLFYDREQPKPWSQLAVMFLTIILFSAGISFVVYLHDTGRMVAAYVMTVLLFANLTVAYYLAWCAVLAHALVLILVEFLVRAATCRLSSPVRWEEGIQLAAIVNPGLRGLRLAGICKKVVPFAEASFAAKECVICMGAFARGEGLRQLKCHADHVFHSECLDQWLNVQRVCPICRAIIV